MNSSNQQQQAVIVPLNDEVILQLEGPESAKFLQGQTTADFAQPEPLDAISGAFCDVKGRVIADFLALVINAETILLRTHQSLAEPLMAHLKKFLLFAKADLRLSEWHCEAVIGPESHRELGIDPNTLSVSKACATDSGNNGGYLLTRQLPGDIVMSEWWTSVRKDTDTNDTSMWYTAAIDRGEARVVADTMGKYLPQDLNYDVNGTVNFKKGCYTGQEIIARLHWRGTPKRRLYQATCDGSVAPSPGCPLTDSDNKSAGSIVNAVHQGDRAVLAIETTEDGLERGLYIKDSSTRLEMR